MSFFGRLAQFVVCGWMLMSIGCANLETVHHRFQYDGGGDPPQKMRAVSVDANQRFLVTSYGKPNKDVIDAWRACAEPSPDAMGAFGGSIAAGISNSKTDAQVAAALASQAASIGLRTQSITLLRDAQYRLCEAYVNGAISGRQLATLHRRFQNIMVANLAIEQLTGYARPTITSVGVGGAAGAQVGLAEAQKALDDARAGLAKKEMSAADAKKKTEEAAAAYGEKKDATAKAKASLPPAAKTTRDLADARAKTASSLRKTAEEARAKWLVAKTQHDPNEAALKTAFSTADANATAAEAAASDLKKQADELNKPADDAQVAENKAKSDVESAAKAQKDAETAVADAKDNVSALEDARDAARNVSATGVPANGSTVFSPPPSPAATKEVADAVTRIVERVMSQNYTDDSCLDYLTDATTIDAQAPAVLLCLFKMNYDANLASGQTPAEATSRSFADPTINNLLRQVLPNLNALPRDDIYKELERIRRYMEKKEPKN